MYRKAGSIGGVMAIALTVVAACGQSEPYDPAIDTAAETEQIDQLREDFVVAIAAQDFGALAALSNPEFEQTLPGGPEHLKMYEFAAGPLPPGYSLDITPKEIVVIDEEWAYEYGTTIVSYQPDGADSPQRIPNTYLMILKKHEGRWTPYREVASASAPPGGWPSSE
ncbi:nuclear transport factor 2 family protein [Hyphomonas sp.]|jgi:ketosteroid isomerase-like protein|uniref:nuclear transport factor 2 family protein n=1 Tax=Hyphomonas sp. TaxID=87 RepID=UPI0025BA58A6|nr:nuclear transport factor 2 family protein [Hyphomonas sp.]